MIAASDDCTGCIKCQLPGVGTLVLRGFASLHQKTLHWSWQLNACSASCCQTTGNSRAPAWQKVMEHTLLLAAQMPVPTWPSSVDTRMLGIRKSLPNVRAAASCILAGAPT